MLTIATLKTVAAQHADDALVLVAIFRDRDGEGEVVEVVDWDANGEHLQLHVAPGRQYTWGMED